MKSGLKKLNHRSHCPDWNYMVKASSRYMDVLHREETRLQKRYSKDKKDTTLVYEPTDLVFIKVEK